ncbi:MAG: VOC family protein [Candidatus Marinimicrobia bacterium]|jgi:hypothetical protein|nr:VOC family protein [Candidatus Neomarinimicrobiota bacterium]
MADFNAKNNRAVWVDIPVADLDRAKQFYEAVMNIKVFTEEFGDVRFCVLDHENGNGGCLVINEKEISSDSGILVYMNVDERIHDAVAKVESSGGSIIEPAKTIGPHGVRAVVLDSEGNRIALHSTVDK